MSRQDFEKRLEQVMGPSKQLILPDEEITKSNTMERIFTVLENMQRDRTAFCTNNTRPELITSPLSQWPYSSPSVSPVKIAKNKKLTTLASKTPVESPPMTDLSMNLLELERSKSARLRAQLESSLERERHLRKQVEELLEALETRHK